MLGAFFIFYTPLFFSMQNTMAHFSKQLVVENRVNDIRVLAGQWMRKCMRVGLLFLLLSLLVSRPLAGVFHLRSVCPVALTAVILVASLMMPVFAGAFQGMQRFGWMAVASNGWTVVRLGLAIPLVLWAASAESALIAHLLGVLICIWFGSCAFYRTIPDPVSTGQPLEQAGSYFFGSLAAIFFYSILMNADIVMVKLFFPGEEAFGPYARASVIGRMVVFLSQPIAGALFPKVVARQGRTSAALGALLRAVMLSALLVAGVVTVCSLFPRLPLAVLFGERAPSAELIYTVRCVVWAMAPLSLVFLIMNFELAQNRFAPLIPLGICAVVFVVGFGLVHPAPVWAAGWLLLAGLAALTSLVVQMAWPKKRVRPGSQ
jgi:O-antigen/teichoic acid export membrane protein